MSWITDAIQDYKNDRMSLEDLVEKLGTAKYPDPTGEPTGLEAYAQSDPGDGEFTEGTYQEVQQALWRGTLTSEEFNLINNKVNERR